MATRILWSINNLEVFIYLCTSVNKTIFIIIFIIIVIIIVMKSEGPLLGLAKSIY